MLKEDLNIELNFEYKRTIVQSIQEGLRKYSNQYKSEFKTKTNNGRHFIIWDFINTEVSREMPKQQFQIIVSKRGIWEFILIYDKDTKCLYSLMKQKRFDDLIHKVKNDNVHYLEALVAINSDLNELADNQISLFELTNEERKECIDKTLEQMLHMLKDEVERYVLITFVDRNYEVISVSSSIVTENLDVVYSEGWEGFIQPEFDIVIGSLEESHDIDDIENDDIPLPLKVAANEEIVSQKEIEKQEKEKMI